MLEKKYVGWVWINLKYKTIIYQKDIVPEEYLNEGYYCANPEILEECFLPHVQILYNGCERHHVIEAQPEFFKSEQLKEQIFNEFNIDAKTVEIIPVKDVGIIFPKKEKLIKKAF